MKKIFLFLSATVLTIACTKSHSTSSNYSQFECICSYQNSNYTTYHIDTFLYPHSDDSLSVFDDCQNVKTPQEQHNSPFGSAVCVLWH